MPDTDDPWPLRHLVLRTPRLELRPDDDEGLIQLAAVAQRGVHPPDEMPFVMAWTDVPPAEIGPNTLRFHWAQRATVVGGDFTVNFLVRLDGRVIGAQALRAKRFPVTREVSSGSWLGQEFQGHGYGTEMRAAMLLFAFDHLGATTARSSAFAHNTASQRVSQKLGYAQDGTELQVVRDERVVDTRLLLTPDRFVRPSWELDTEGVDACVPFLATGRIPTNGS